ncbi:hypothetical protein A6V37_37900 [Paraburkholderia ginsengiterrae]|uniref:Uncharacterized protein n=1 Tax=Paraburkholderia ginsengiterrae TaxID=1462993 RepID=A0A1A9NEC5_9BURK|nr:hypothetical protein A6V37_37900 [Paraburkholderia ginsengiterrae]
MGERVEGGGRRREGGVAWEQGGGRGGGAKGGEEQGGECGEWWQGGVGGGVGWVGECGGGSVREHARRVVEGDGREGEVEARSAGVAAVELIDAAQQLWVGRGGGDGRCEHRSERGEQR